MEHVQSHTTQGEWMMVTEQLKKRITLVTRQEEILKYPPVIMTEEQQMKVDPGEVIRQVAKWQLLLLMKKQTSMEHARSHIKGQTLMMVTRSLELK